MQQVTGYCGWCGERFTYTRYGEEVKVFCKPKHKRNSSRAAKNMRSLCDPGVCPTPKKKTYLTRDAAVRVIGDTPTLHRGARPYMCSCGFWHLGHAVKGTHHRDILEENERQRRDHADAVLRVAQAIAPSACMAASPSR